MKISSVFISELSEGWTQSKLGDVCEYLQYGWTTSAKHAISGLHLLRTTDISTGNIDWQRVPFCDEEPNDPEKYLLQKGDIVVSRAGSVGISYLLENCPRAVFASYLIRLRVQSPLPPEFVRFFLQSPNYWTSIADNSAGIAVQNINATKLRDIDIPLPPLAEQKRIVAKVEELLARVNTARERLSKIPALLKRFRQSVLATLISGEEIKLGKILDDLKYGTSQKCVLTPNGVPVLRIPNISEGFIEQNELKYAELNRRELESLRLKSSDILMIRSNGSVSLLGKTAIVSEKEEGYAYAGYLMRLRVNKKSANSRYIHFALSSQDCRDQIEMPARSTSGVHNINSVEVRQLRIPLPSLEEQREIVRRIDALFALADKIEARVKSATARVEKITQAILAKAFRGELVPTEAELARAEGRNYETAEQLLKRILSNPKPKEKNTPQERERSKMTRSTRKPAKSVRPLAEVLLEKGKLMSAENLLDAAGYSDETIEEFYCALRDDVKRGIILDPRDHDHRIMLARNDK